MFLNSRQLGNLLETTLESVLWKVARKTNPDIQWKKLLRKYLKFEETVVAGTAGW